MMAESVRFPTRAARMDRSDPDCAFTAHGGDPLCHTYAGDLEPSRNISLIAHMVQS